MTLPEQPEECILAIDTGTQSIRAALINFKGTILKITRTELEPYFSNYPGWAEQNPEYFWKSLVSSCKKLFSELPAAKKAILAVTLTTQRNTMINLDNQGKPLRPAIVWLDRRKAKKPNWPPFHIKSALKLLNLYDTIEYAMTESEANWISQNEPEIWERTYKFLFLSGYLTYRLTGEFTDSTGNQVGYVPFDYKKHKWADKNDVKWKILPSIKRSQLPELVKPSEILGYISQNASRQTGIPAGIPLVAAAADKACEVLGSGCITPDIACLSLGTTATVEITNKKYREIIPFLPPFPSAVPDAYNLEVMIYRGYWMISWFKREFAHEEVLLAKKKKVSVESFLDTLADNIPPGSMGLTVQPFWSPGIKIPGPEAKGAIIGFGDIHTKKHIYRAILEGLTYALRDGATRIEKCNKIRIEKLRVSGGGSQSRTAMQLAADIFNLPAEQPHTYETSAVGAAIDAAVGLGIFSGFREAVNEMTRIQYTFEPDKERSKIYDELFCKVYMKIYKKMKPLYKDIREITGYPAIF